MYKRQPFIPNRDQLDARQLKTALENLQLKEDKSFHYTDVNFLLLGFWLEDRFHQPLDRLFEELIFTPVSYTHLDVYKRQIYIATRLATET